MSSNESWFSEKKGVFGPEYLLELEGVASEEKLKKEVDFFEKNLSLQPDNKILDVPCGHGRYAIELAKRGYDVTGFELNDFFIKKAKEDGKKAGVSVAYQQGDMRTLDFESQFDVVMNLHTSLGYFESDTEDEQIMSRIYTALKPGGKFVICFRNQSWLARNFKPKVWRKLSNGTYLLVEREYDHVRGRTVNYRTKIKDGVVQDTVTTSLRAYTAPELIRMASTAGFTLKAGFGDPEGNSIGVDSEDMYLFFDKPSH